jgi:hypothetical protein
MIKHIFAKDSFNHDDSMHLAYRNEPDKGDFTHCLIEMYCGSSDSDLGIWLLPSEVEELIVGLQEYLEMMNDRPVVHRFSHLDKKEVENEGRIN